MVDEPLESSQVLRSLDVRKSHSSDSLRRESLALMPPNVDMSGGWKRAQPAGRVRPHATAE